MLIEENLILKERSYGIEQSMQSLISNASTEHLKIEKMNSHHQLLRDLVAENEDLKSQCVEISQRLATAMQNINYESVKYLDIISAKDRFIIKCKEKVGQYKVEVDRVTRKRDELEGLLEVTKRDLDILNREYEEVRRRITSTKVAAIEKVCINCKKLYQESENMNWSCKTHMSQYSANMWWCCGKSNHDAEGCKVGLHASKENPEEQGMKYFSKLLCTVIFI